MSIIDLPFNSAPLYWKQKRELEKMEKKIMEVIRRMQGILNQKQQKELENVLMVVLSGCRIVEETAVKVVNEGWKVHMDDFLMSKMLEGKSEESVKRYQYELRRLLSYIDKDVEQISSGDISQYMRMYKMIRKVSNQTLKNVRAVYSSFFGWLRDRNRISLNPMIMVEDIKVEKVIKKPFTDEEREKILRECNTIRDKAMVEFLYSTAVRVSELSRINRGDIQFAQKDLVVLGKGGKERRVYINEKTNMYLKEYLKTREDECPALFVSLKNPHKRLSKEGIEDVIRRIGKRADVEKAYPHRFRRTALTNALNRGMPLQEAMIMAGHSKPETTMRYCTVDQEAVKYHHKKYLSA